MNIPLEATSASESDDRHKLGVRITIRSEAVLKLWTHRMCKVGTLIEHEPYRFVVGLRNLAKQQFPGGSMELVVLWATERKTYRRIEIPLIRAEEVWEKEIVPTDTIGSSGLALIYCSTLTAEDKQLVILYNWSGFEKYDLGDKAKYAIHDFHSVT